MQRTNSEYGSPYLATHHFPFPFFSFPLLLCSFFFAFPHKFLLVLVYLLSMKWHEKLSFKISHWSLMCSWLTVGGQITAAVCVLEREMQSFLTVWTWLKSYPICFSTLQSSFVSVSLCWDTYVLVWYTVPSLKIFDLLLLYNLLVQNIKKCILFYFILFFINTGLYWIYCMFN